MTLEPVGGINGATFPAQKCQRAGCLQFTFQKAYQGYWTQVIEQGKPGSFRETRDLRGVYVKIVVKQTCCGCEKVRFIQIVRDITKGGKDYVSADPVDEVRRKRSGYDPQTGKPVEGAPSLGWRVDRLIDANDPYYDSGGNANAGAGKNPAELYDAAAGDTLTRNFGKEFYTCAICGNKGKEDTILGCVRWGFYVNDDRAVSFYPAKPEASCTYPPEFKDVFTRWGGAKPNFDPAKLK
jgi:hypothetical protein